ncbi:hypothetical protein [Streptomyces sp. NPDC057496]|uniref:hypothetical protein n=1 Tax=Streptomyces sp. NPDC057496 TaxID=3346149 RepID=UPI00369B0D75
MKIALVCGDGLPVSGLLSVFRNVVDIAVADGLVELPVPADLGFSWRPDKPVFYPEGVPDAGYPDWLEVTLTRPVPDQHWFAEELTRIRDAVARPDLLSSGQAAELSERIDRLATPYEEYFAQWLDKHQVDWVVAVNMTLSDAVPVTLALHRAAARHWADDRPGGLLFWDHDLFASYAVHEGEQRVYPHVPNAFTPLPGTHPSHRWAVVCEPLARESATYPTGLSADLVPNVLPVPRRDTTDRRRRFLAQIGADPERPIILCPVRMFRVKGVEIAVGLLAAVRENTRANGRPTPLLLVFGALGEDPEYAQEVLAAVAAADIAPDIRFLDGVPLTSFQDTAGHWHLDETDLLALCRASHGGVFFTPNRPDVESVGLGPALAAVAGVPCATTAYEVLDDIYGDGFRQVLVRPDAITEAGAEFADRLDRFRRGDEQLHHDLAHNRDIVAARFPDRPWRDLLTDMAALIRGDHR